MMYTKYIGDVNTVVKKSLKIVILEVDKTRTLYAHK